jgi:acyl-CoA oxidase
MRNDVVGLTDGFGLPDFILKAPISKYNGDIYPGKKIIFRVYNKNRANSMFSYSNFLTLAYFETLLQAPGSVGVPPYHTKYIKPLTERFEKKQ